MASLPPRTASTSGCGLRLAVYPQLSRQAVAGVPTPRLPAWRPVTKVPRRGDNLLIPINVTLIRSAMLGLRGGPVVLAVCDRCELSAYDLGSCRSATLRDVDCPMLWRVSGK
jgi:hypothetical protein